MLDWPQQSCSCSPPKYCRGPAIETARSPEQRDAEWIVCRARCCGAVRPHASPGPRSRPSRHIRPSRVGLAAFGEHPRTTLPAHRPVVARIDWLTRDHSLAAQRSASYHRGYRGIECRHSRCPGDRHQCALACWCIDSTSQRCGTNHRRCTPVRARRALLGREQRHSSAHLRQVDRSDLAASKALDTEVLSVEVVGSFVHARLAQALEHAVAAQLTPLIPLRAGVWLCIAGPFLLTAVVAVF